MEQLAKPPADAEKWVITSTAGQHGQSQRWTTPDGARWSRESLLLRGFITEIDQELRFAKNGALIGQSVRGTVPEGDATETFRVEKGEYSFKSPVDDGRGALKPNQFYISFGGTIDSAIALVDALRKAPNQALDLLPSGRAHLEQLTTLEVSNGQASKTVTAYAVVGLSFAPLPVWYDGDHFFAVASFLNYLPTGWESVAPALSKAQDEALAARAPALVARIARKPTGPIAFQNVRLYDADARTFRDAMTVIVTDGHISAVGPAASAKIPPGAQVIDGTAKTLIPGLWDNHQHYGDDGTGPLLLAQGITSVRDPGNLPDELMARKKRIDQGELLGPRIVPSLLIDGPGPLSAQVAVVVTTQDEAIAAVHRAKDMGYFGIKLYGSLNPAFVKPMAAEAHRLGLRVHGHIPAGMRPLEAVRAGYDEITHINFVMMQAMPDEVVKQSNGLMRFFGPGRYAAGVDLKAKPMRDYLDELARRGTAADPTLVVFESTFVPERGEMAPAYAPFIGTLPPSVERGVRSGGLKPPEDLPRATMRKSFEAMRALVGELAQRHVTFLAGTDGTGLELVRELELYVGAGLTPAEALASATIVPAKAFGLGGQTGSLAPGKLAELALVDGDPSRNIGDLRQVELVMRDGRIMKAADLRAAIGITGPPSRAP
jgi:imidazolonepropionase-like amidohydrolase